MVEASNIFREPKRLRTKAETVSEADIASKEIQHLIAAMIEVSWQEGFLAVTPNNISEVDLPNVSIVFADEHGQCDYSNPLITFNPEVEELDDVIVGHEGCGSLFVLNENNGDKVSLFCKVLRFRSLKVLGLDLNGEPIEQLCRNVTATVLQHELDHLQGRVMSDFAVEDPHFNPALAR